MININKYLRDRMGSTAAVVDDDGRLVQTTGYYPSGTPYRLPSSTIGTPVDGQTDRLHIGNKWLGHSGLAMYDNTARLHDPLLMRFSTPDPLYAKFGSLSPWSHCASDPLNFVDVDGEKPSKKASALLSQNVYENRATREAFNQEGWHVSNFNTSIKLENGWTGFKSCLYERTVNNVTEYAYAFAGTDGLSLMDWGNNIRQVVGLSEQYAQAVHNAEVLSKELGNAELTFVGHSLGGGLAAAASLKTGKEAITFNPAAVSPLTKFFQGLSNSDKNITNYVSSGTKVSFGGFSFWIGGDPLYNTQKAAGINLDGKTFFIPTGSPVPSHSIKDIVKSIEDEKNKQ